MSTRAQRKPELPVQPIVVALTEAERTELGVRLLSIRDGIRRSEVLADLEHWLGQWAKDLANSPNVLLRSDLVSVAAPLAQRAKTFRGVLDRCDSRVRFLFQTLGFGDFGNLSEQLRGFDAFLDWLQKEPSKRGGERSAYRSQCNRQGRFLLDAWFTAHAGRRAATPLAERRRRFLQRVQRVVERAVKAQSSRLNTGKK